MRQFTDADRLRLDRARDHYLRECYRKRTAARAEEFASYLGVTAAYLSRFATLVSGTPVRDFLRQSQLAHAADLLMRTPLPVDEIAIASGFGTPSTFYRCFVAAYGTTPAEYRRAHSRS